MAKTFYVPIENKAQPLNALQRWFFLVVEAADACDALIVVRPIMRQMRLPPVTTWWPQEGECPTVDYMRDLRAGLDASCRQRLGRRAA